MASYHLVYSTFWAETQSWADDERVCALFLLTCEHRKAEGLYRLPSAYAAHDMGWSADRFDAALTALVGRGWAMRDGDWVLLVNGLRWNPPKSKTQATGAARAVADVPLASPLYRAFHTAAERYANHTDGLFGRLPAPIDAQSIPHRDGIDVPLEGDSGPSDTPSISHTPTPSLAPTPTQAAASPAGAHVREAAADWRAIEPTLSQVPEWAAAIEQGASLSCLALLEANRDVPWVEIAGAAAASRLDPDAGLRTNSPRQALDMQLADHRSGRSTGAGERGASRRRAQRSSLDHYRDMAAEFEAEAGAKS